MADKTKETKKEAATENCAQQNASVADSSGKDVSSKSSEEKQYLGMSRRSFAIGTGGACALLAMGGLKYVPAKAQVRPPGGQDEDHLVSACIRCQRCVEACPKSALVPTHLEEGLLGVRMPTTDFNRGWCDFCTESHNGEPQCVKFCPTEALKLKDNATAKNTILGKAVIIHDWCLAWSKYNGCKFCYDACPYDAITLETHGRPVVDRDKCNGCGACQNACVSLEDASITEGATSRAIIVVPESRAGEYEN